MPREIAVRRVEFGYFVRPGEETETGVDRVEPVLGYMIRHPAGVLLVDSGMGSHPVADARYRPHRIGLAEALAASGVDVSDVSAVVNCHLHFDHCGGNPTLGGRPVFVQTEELTNARTAGYTLPELVEGPGIVYEELSGQAEIWPGVTVVPTPGHTSGHQSVVVQHEDGRVTVLAGQSHDTATAFGGDALAVRATADGHPPPLPIAPSWMPLLLTFDPRVVYFAHDHAVWTADAPANPPL